MEIWKIVDGFENYAVSNLGRVKSIKTNKILIGGKDRNGYKCVNISKNCKPFFRPIHRLVALNFLDRIDGKDFVNHIDGDKTNNNLSNLEWCNQYENNTHMKLLNGKKCKSVGVSYCSKRQKYSSTIRVNKKSKFLGRFNTEEEAHQAYLQAMIKYNIVNKYASNHSI